MTNDRKAFEAAILAAPDDDAPILVYADWLDDRGESRKAAATRRAAVALPSADQWAIIEGALALCFEPHGKDLRLSFGGWSYFIGEGDPKRLARQLRQAIEREVEYVRMKMRRGVTGGKYWRPYQREWDRVFRRVFRGGVRVRGVRMFSLSEALSATIHRKVRERGVTFRALGLSSTRLGYDADDAVLNLLTGAEEWGHVDPASIPDLPARLKAAVEDFDPWAFDWSSKGCHFQPKQRERLEAAGFRFSAGAPTSAQVGELAAAEKPC